MHEKSAHFACTYTRSGTWRALARPWLKRPLATWPECKVLGPTVGLRYVIFLLGHTSTHRVAPSPSFRSSQTPHTHVHVRGAKQTQSLLLLMTQTRPFFQSMWCHSEGARGPRHGERVIRGAVLASRARAHELLMRSSLIQRAVQRFTLSPCPSASVNKT